MADDRAAAYADWIVKNQDKAGTPEFETVASAYKQLRGQSAPPAQQPQSFGAWAADQGKFIGGRLANAALSVPGLPADLLGLELAGLDYISGQETPTANPLEAFTGKTIRGAAHDYGSRALRAAGFNAAPEDLAPRDPRNTTERLVGNIADFVGYGAGPGALTKGALTSAAGGGAGLTAAQEIAPDSTLVQIAGALAGHRAPAAIASRGASTFPASRAFLRGRNASSIDDELAAYDRLSQQTGAPVSVMPGQLAGEYNIQQVIDALIARSPGGQPGVLRANESQAKLLDEAIMQRAANPTGRANVGPPSPTSTGNRILADFEAKAQNFRARQTKIEDLFEQRIGADTRVPMVNTMRALDELRSRAASDPKIAALIQDPYIKRVEAALTGESGAAASVGLSPQAFAARFGGGDGSLSYSAARALKTDAGELLPKAGKLGNVKAGQLKKLYGALAEDITQIARAKGVGGAWERYNKWASDTYDKTSKIYDKITKGKEYSPERVSDSFKNLDATSMRIAMRNLSPEGRAVAAGQLLYEAAKTKAAGAAVQDVATSYQKFLGNILEMKKRGTFDAAFGAPEFAPLRDTIDDITKVSKGALRANVVAHDVSGATTIRAGAVASIVGLAAAGQVPAAASVFALTFLAPAVAGKVLRSKAYLNWLAYARKAKPHELRTVLQRLEMVAVRDRDPETRTALQQLAPAIEQIIAPAN